MKYKWKIENRYDNNEYGPSVSKRILEVIEKQLAI